MNQQIPNIETGIAEIDAFVRTSYRIRVLDAWDRLLAERQELQAHIEKLKVAGRNLYTQLAFGYDFHIPELGGTLRQEFELELEILRQVLEEVDSEPRDKP